MTKRIPAWLLSALVMLLLATVSQAQTIGTDKADYVPGETVQITGSGYHANETITLQVDATDGFGWQTDDRWTATTDAGGNLSSTWAVTEAAADRAFILSANCQHDGPDPEHLYAECFFTDSVSAVALTSPTGASPVTLVSVPTNVVVSFTYSTNNTGTTSGTVNVKSGSTIIATATKSLTTGSGTFSDSISVTIPTGTGNGNYNVEVVVTNTGTGGPGSRNTGNTGNSGIIVSLDTTAPTTTVTTTPARNAFGYTNSNTTVTLNASDSGTGVASITYSVAGPQNIAQTTVNAANVTTSSLNQNGTYTVSYSAKDVAGNTEATGTYTFTIDKTAPTTTATASPAANANGWRKADTTVTLSGSDSSSGIANTYYYLTGAQTAGSAGVPIAATSASITTNGSTTIHYWSTDKAGNLESEKTLEIKLDKENPTISLTSPAANAYVRSSVNLVASGSDTHSCIATVEHYIDNVLKGQSSGGTISFDTTAMADGDHAWLAKAIDNADNNASTAPRTIKIDNTKPTLSIAQDPAANAAGWNKGTVYVTLSAADGGSGVQSITYTLDGSPVTANQANVQFQVSGEGTHTLTATSTDVAGNVSTQASATIKIDMTAPATAASQNPAQPASGWNNGDVTVTLSPSDSGSGIASTSYRIDGGAAQPYMQPFVISAEGDHTVTFSSIDVADNAEIEQSVHVRVDKTAPVPAIDIAPAPNGAGWNNTDVNVTVSGTDLISGVASVSYKINGGSPSTQSGSSFGFPINGDGVVSVDYWATDNAGNASSPLTKSVKIDKIKPTSTSSLSQAPSSFGWNNQDVTVTLNATDTQSGSGVAGIVYKVNNGDPQLILGDHAVVSAITAEGTTTINYYAIDAAGNQEDTHTLVILLDKTAPTAEFGAQLPAANGYGWNNSSVSVPYSASDSLSGLDPNTPAGALSFNSQGDNQLVSVTIRDKAGNETTISRPEPVRIDTTPPVISGTDESDSVWHNAPQSRNYGVTDTLSGVVDGDGSFMLALTADSTKNAMGSVVPTSASRTVHDKAGNSATRSFSALIDTVPPVITPGTVSGTAGENDWYLTDVIRHFSAEDELSGLAISGDQAFDLNASGEGASVALGSKTVTDQAGNSATSQPETFKIDKTDPVVNPSNFDGLLEWFNADVTKSFTSSDAISGLANPADGSFNLVASAQSLNPNTPTVASRTVKDKAGRQTVRTVSALIDLTPPVIGVPGMPVATAGSVDGATQWYRSMVSVLYTASDALSGLKDANDASFTLKTSGEGPNVPLESKTVLDNAENPSSPAPLTFAIDYTNPVVSLTPDRTANGLNWYNAPVTFTTTATDPVSGVSSVTAPQTYSGPDVATASITGYGTDKAGNSGPKTVSFGYDATAPSVEVYGLGADAHIPSATIHAVPADNLSGVSSAIAKIARRTDKGLWYSYPADAAHFSAANEVWDSLHPVLIDKNNGGEGNYTLVLIVKDAAGNETIATRQFTIDGTAPQIIFGAIPEEGEFYYDDQKVTFDVIDALDLSPVVTGRSITTSNNDGDLTTQFFDNFVWAKIEGHQKVTVSAKDGADNEATNSRKFTIDRTAPDTVAPILGLAAPNAEWFESLDSFALIATDPRVQGVNTPGAANAAGYPGSGVVGLTYQVNTLAPVPATGNPVLVNGSSNPFNVGLIVEGEYEVVFHAVDKVGNTEASKTVPLRLDHTAPTVTGPNDTVLEATSAAGAPLSFSFVANDNVRMDDDHPLTISHASGYVFPLDQTVLVTATAKDKAGHTAQKSFSVKVQDTTPPVLGTMPVDKTVEATSAAGAVVTFVVPSATDIVDTNPTVVAVPASGSTFPLGDTTVKVTATDSHGNKSIKTFKVTVQDTTAPHITPPNPIIAEATGPAGAAVTFSVNPATDAVDGTVNVVANPDSGSTFPIGDTPVSLSATDNAHNTGMSSFTVTVRDTTPPVISNVPANITAEATSAGGAVVTYAIPTALDIVDGAVVVSSVPPTGSTFAIGTTTVNISTTDAHNNKSFASFTVTVTDTTAPDITVPGNQTVEATGPNGAAVAFSASALDIVDGAVAVEASPVSGSTFGIGTTTVTVTAKDAHNNSASASFTVTVQDTTAPVISNQNDITLEATGADGAIASYSLTANDLVDGLVAVISSPASGSTFAIGQTTVSNKAMDSRSNTATSTFKVIVQDTTAPAITVPGPITAEATGPGGASVTFSVSANDIVDGAVNVTTDHNSGSAFPLGTTTVTATASDAHGNSASMTFTVTVQDTTAPVITAPSDMTVEATKPGGADVSFSATAADIVSGSVNVVATPASGSTFALGMTTVKLCATDAAGNKSEATFKINVVDTTAPAISDIADVSVEATGPDGANASFNATATDLVDGNVPVTFDPKSSGAKFGLGETIEKATATDSRGNKAEKSFKVTVTDKTPPTIGAVAPVTAEATGPNGAAVSFPIPTATDIVDGAVQVTCTPASGSTFPIGNTTVVCSATDAHNNTVTKCFVVTVQDKTAPVITVPANMIVTANSATGAIVTFAASATDVVDGSVATYATPASGSLFPLGPKTVNVTATDSHGNSATKSFMVTVQFAGNFFLQPINVDGSSIFKQGSTVPVKFKLSGASAGIANVVAKLYLASVSNNVVGTELEAVSTSAADTGNTFRYDASADQYIFNLSTKNLAAGSWQLKIDLGDGVLHTVVISLKK